MAGAHTSCRQERGQGSSQHATEQDAKPREQLAARRSMLSSRYLPHLRHAVTIQDLLQSANRFSSHETLTLCRLLHAIAVQPQGAPLADPLRQGGAMACSRRRRRWLLLVRRLALPRCSKIRQEA